MTLVIVCGGRGYTDTERVFAELDKVYAAKPDLFIIHGGAAGADQRAAEWAASRGVPCAEVPAHWDYFGKKAGPTRNGWMLRLKPAGVVAFPGGDGTADCVAQARIAGVPVKEIK